MMLKIAHIINPVKVKKSSDLYMAQPTTFETMKIAKMFANTKLEVDLFTAQYEEDLQIIPDFFFKTPNLDRSILDLKDFRKKRKLPFIKDILDRLYYYSTAEYLIYTNADIALMPQFYLSVGGIIEQGYDAFVINRRSIPGRYSSLNEIPLMYAEIGKKHPGFDCFVFHRKLYKKLDLGRICIGTTKIGVTVITNLICKAKKFKLFEDLHLTFHIGEVREWQDERFKDYVEHNERDALRILSRLEKSYRRRFNNSPICMKHLKMLKEKYNS
jgi:hypothetical protein